MRNDIKTLLDQAHICYSAAVDKYYDNEYKDADYNELRYLENLVNALSDAHTNAVWLENFK